MTTANGVLHKDISDALESFVLTFAQATAIERLARLNLPASLDGALVLRCSEPAPSSASADATPLPVTVTPAPDDDSPPAAVPLHPLALSDFDEISSLLVVCAPCLISFFLRWRMNTYFFYDRKHLCELIMNTVICSYNKLYMPVIRTTAPLNSTGAQPSTSYTVIILHQIDQYSPDTKFFLKSNDCLLSFLIRNRASHCN